MQQIDIDNIIISVRNQHEQLKQAVNEVNLQKNNRLVYESPFKTHNDYTNISFNDKHPKYATQYKKVKDFSYDKDYVQSLLNENQNLKYQLEQFKQGIEISLKSHKQLKQINSKLVFQNKKINNQLDNMNKISQSNKRLFQKNQQLELKINDQKFANIQFAQNQMQKYYDIKQQNIILKENNKNLRQVLEINYDCEKYYKDHYSTNFDYEKQLQLYKDKVKDKQKEKNMSTIEKKKKKNRTFSLTSNTNITMDSSQLNISSFSQQN